MTLAGRRREWRWARAEKTGDPMGKAKEAKKDVKKKPAKTMKEKKAAKKAKKEAKGTFTTA